MGKWVISKPYPKYLGNIQTLPNYLLPIKNWVLLRIIGSGRVGYPLPNGYGHPYLRDLKIYIYFCCTGRWQRIFLHKLHRILIIDKNILNWNWGKTKRYFMRMRFSRNIIYTWGRKKRVCKRVRIFALIYTWEWSNLGHNM